MSTLLRPTVELFSGWVYDVEVIFIGQHTPSSTHPTVELFSGWVYEIEGMSTCPLSHLSWELMLNNGHG